MAEASMRVEVAIIGGGPAGAAAARRLAEDGHEVIVFARRPSRRRTLAESLPPSAGRLLGVLGLQAAVDAAGFMQTTGNTVWWGHEEARTALFANGARGYQVDRATFDEVLLEAAREAGATVRYGTVVRAVEHEAGWRVSAVDRRTTPIVVDAAYVLDCSGRTGVLARSTRQRERTAPTLALVADWARPGGWVLADPTHTVVESYGDGWVWSVPRSLTERVVACMIDPRAARGRPMGSLGARYRAELAKTQAVAGLLRDAVQTSPVWACDATMYTSRRVAGARHLLVGDAASFLDPISSYGIKKALASAWLAATAVHTALVRPTLAEVAFGYFATHEAKLYAAYRAQSVRYFREAEAVHAHPFWRARADLDADQPWDDDLDIDALRAAPDVVAAFTRLRRSRTGRLRPTSAFQIEFVPAVTGRQIGLVPRLVTPSLPGVRYLRGIDVPRVVELARVVDSVPDLVAAYARDRVPVKLPDFLGVLSVLLARGVLTLTDEPA